GGKRDALVLTERLMALDEVEGSLQRADVLRSLRREDEANALLETLADAHPNNPKVRLRLGFDALNAKRYDRAIGHFTAASGAPLAGATDEARLAIYGALYQVGRSHVFAERASDDAADALRRYIADAPADNNLPGKDWAHFRLGELLTLNGDTDAARNHFERALASTDDKDLVRRAKARLN
ncbi:MAG: tetratricopeptide repeat protein, partial [Pseudomonadota bacterium]